MASIFKDAGSTERRLPTDAALRCLSFPMTSPHEITAQDLHERSVHQMQLVLAIIDSRVQLAPLLDDGSWWQD